MESHYYIKHPDIDNPEIYVKVSTGKPQAAIKRERQHSSLPGLWTGLRKKGKEELQSTLHTGTEIPDGCFYVRVIGKAKTETEGIESENFYKFPG